MKRRDASPLYARPCTYCQNLPMFRDEYQFRMTLPRPQALSDEHWDSIQYHLAQLREATEARDRPRIVGSAKDLVEATSGVVLTARGQQAPSEPDFSRDLRTAHDELLKPTATELSNDAKKVAGHARKLANELRTLRNLYGTGHGRVTVPEITDELVEVCVDGALIWTRWALRRLHYYLIGDLERLIQDLHGGTSFMKGRLAERLMAANLSNMPPEDQRRLGVAVGQRAATGTFNVWNDGVEPCVESSNTERWPNPYREGLAEGLFIDSSGQIRVGSHDHSVRTALEVLLPHSERADVLDHLATKASQAMWAASNRATPASTAAQMHRAATLLDNDERSLEAWNTLKTQVDRHVTT